MSKPITFVQSLLDDIYQDLTIIVQSEVKLETAVAQLDPHTPSTEDMEAIKQLRAKIDRRHEEVLIMLDLVDFGLGKIERQKRTKKESL